MRPRLLFAVLGITMAAGPVAPATEKGTRAVGLSVEKVEFQGWKNNLKIQNGDAELIVTLDVGPRVLSYRLADGKNMFKVYEDMAGKSGEDAWMIRGGHRLWAAPEDPQRTYALDNAPVAFQELGPGHVRFTPKPEQQFGLQKEFDLQLEPTGSQVTVTHRIKNVGDEETSLAVWSLSVMAPGGIEVIPLPAKRPHPGDAKNARGPEDFAPNVFLSVWPFLDFQDARWHFGSKFITLAQDASKGATKLGLAHKTGGVGYLNGGTLFVKKFGWKDGEHYPDHGVNFETFTNEDMLEMESLGPLTKLAPGQAVEHVETWQLFGGLGTAAAEAEIEAKIAPRLR